MLIVSYRIDNCQWQFIVFTHTIKHQKIKKNMQENKKQHNTKFVS